MQRGWRKAGKGRSDEVMNIELQIDLILFIIVVPWTRYQDTVLFGYTSGSASENKYIWSNGDLNPNFYNIIPHTYQKVELDWNVQWFSNRLYKNKKNHGWGINLLMCWLIAS